LPALPLSLDDGSTCPLATGGVACAMRRNDVACSLCCHSSPATCCDAPKRRHPRSCLIVVQCPTATATDPNARVGVAASVPSAVYGRLPPRRALLLGHQRHGNHLPRCDQPAMPHEQQGHWRLARVLRHRAAGDLSSPRRAAQHGPRQLAHALQLWCATPCRACNLLCRFLTNLTCHARLQDRMASRARIFLRSTASARPRLSSRVSTHSLPTGM